MTKRDGSSQPARSPCWPSFEFYAVLFRKELKPEWVSEEFLCDKTKREFKFGQSFLLDVMDAVYFDMLIGNLT